MRFNQLKFFLSLVHFPRTSLCDIGGTVEKYKFYKPSAESRRLKWISKNIKKHTQSEGFRLSLEAMWLKLMKNLPNSLWNSAIDFEKFSRDLRMSHRKRIIDDGEEWAKKIIAISFLCLSTSSCQPASSHCDGLCNVFERVPEQCRTSTQSK